MSRNFDKKFGAEFLGSVPRQPGIYFLWGENDVLLYVGKAAVLRTRLSQYRRAKRGEKARKLMQLAVRISWEVCGSELEACLKELEVIQSKRPKKNVTAAFSFMYPFLGIRQDKSALWVCFTTLPAELPDYEMHGAFRSREVTATAFFALTRLLKYIGHPEKPPQDIPDYSYCFGFRRLPDSVRPQLADFLRGHSYDLLENLFGRLLNHAGARAKAAEVKEDLRTLRSFWREEAFALRRVIDATGHLSYPVLQAERDPLFLRAAFAKIGETLPDLTE